MKSCSTWFNCNLLVALVILCAGCETTKDPAKGPETKAATKKSEAAKKNKKERSAVALYLEAKSKADPMNSVPIFRESPVYVTLQAEPFLTSANLVDAAVVDMQDGFALQLKFDSHSAFVLDTLTSANKGKRIAIFAAFPPDQRWLAAPLIQGNNPTGTLTFTPDATREECERIVRGLKNTLAEQRKRGG